MASTCLGWVDSELEPWNPWNKGVNWRLKEGRKRQREVRGYVNTKRALWVGLTVSRVIKSAPPGTHNLWTPDRLVMHWPVWGKENLHWRSHTHILMVERRYREKLHVFVHYEPLDIIFLTNLLRYNVQWIYDLFEKVRKKTRGKGEWRANICCMQAPLKSTLLQCFIPLFIAADCE